MEYSRCLKVAEEMARLALELGATAAGVINANEIVVNPGLVTYCSKGCPSYNTSGNCPPHGPDARAFQLSLDWYQRAVVFKMDLPVSVLMGDARLPASRKLHGIAAALEGVAQGSGSTLTMGVATGGCRLLFCKNQNTCLKIESGCCRHEKLAKPSMSGLGVDFTALCRSLKWPLQKITSKSVLTEDEWGAMAGFVLVG
ncbi:MAG: DUF2284 domain-containing protein [Desulfobacterales bacterium]|nr:DUF2284 domain-containing protein [Desulfobacterales bacterium]